MAQQTSSRTQIIFISLIYYLLQIGFALKLTPLLVSIEVQFFPGYTLRQEHVKMKKIT